MDIHKLTVINSNCKLGKNISIGPFSSIGIPSRLLKLNSKFTTQPKVRIKTVKTILSDGCNIGANVVIEEGVTIGQNVIIEAGAVIEKGVVIGPNSFIVHGARILKDAKIGQDCVIGGLVGDHSVIGNNCRIFGNILHSQDNPLSQWDETIEKAPFIESHVFVGFGAQVIGGIRIKQHTYILSNAIVTKNFGPNVILKNINSSTPFYKWKGKLSNSNFWNKNKN